jgi:hypothetical protein
VLTVNDSHKLWNIPEGKKVVMEYTGAWQPVGKKGLKLRRMTGKIVRSDVFLRISDNWKKGTKNYEGGFMELIDGMVN